MGSLIHAADSSVLRLLYTFYCCLLCYIAAARLLHTFQTARLIISLKA